MSQIKQFLRKIPLLHDAWRHWRGFLTARQIRREFLQFGKMSQQSGPRFKLDWADRWLCTSDRTVMTSFDPVYTYHTAWAARKVAEIKPPYHVDISSLLYFSTLVSAFVPVQFYDFRPADIRLDGLKSEAADLTRLGFADGSIPSLSCLHVVEHIGLGRYGDPLDPDGDVKAMRELQRVLAPGGSILFVTPTGRPRIQFNAHRIYGYDQIVNAFKGLELKEFALLQDAPRDIEGLVYNAPAELANRQGYGCGCYWFVKPARVEAGQG